MIIKNNEIDNMPIEKEIVHIIKSINTMCKKLKIHSMLLLDNDKTIGGKTFFEIYKNNRNKFDCNLILLEGSYKFYTINDDNTNNYDINIGFLLIDNSLCILNTDTIEDELKNGNKKIYNIKVFYDYTRNYLEEILKYYNSNFSKPTEQFDNIIRDYIILPRQEFMEKYTKKEREEFSQQIKSATSTNFTLYNSITKNYFTNVNNDLEKLT